MRFFCSLLILTFFALAIAACQSDGLSGYSGPTYDNWETVVNDALPEGINDVIWSEANQQYILVDGFTVATSPDGFNWTVLAGVTGIPAEGEGLLYITACSATEFMAVTGDGDVLRANNDISTWMHLSTRLSGYEDSWGNAVPASFSSLGCNETNAVALTRSAPIHLGINGVDGWGFVSEEMSDDGARNQVLWAGNTFVAIGNGGQVVTSNDGSGWNPMDAGTTENLNDIAWNGTTLMAAGDTQTLVYTEDFVSWQPVILDRVYQNFTHILPVGERFVAIGDGGAVSVVENGEVYHTGHIPITGDVHAAASNGDTVVVTTRVDGVLVYRIQ